MTQSEAVKVITMILTGTPEEKKVLSRLYPKIAKVVDEAGMYLVLHFVREHGIDKQGPIIFPIHYKGETINLKITVE